MFYGQCWKCGERWALGTASTCKCPDETPKSKWVGLTNDEIINLAIENTIHGLKFDEEGLLRFAKLVASAEREACAYWAGIALLGADRGLSNRVDQAIRAKGNT